MLPPPSQDLPPQDLDLDAAINAALAGIKDSLTEQPQSPASSHHLRSATPGPAAPLPVDPTPIDAIDDELQLVLAQTAPPVHHLREHTPVPGSRAHSATPVPEAPEEIDLAAAMRNDLLRTAVLLDSAAPLAMLEVERQASEHPEVDPELLAAGLDQLAPAEQDFALDDAIGDAFKMLQAESEQTTAPPPHAAETQPVPDVPETHEDDAMKEAIGNVFSALVESGAQPQAPLEETANGDDDNHDLNEATREAIARVRDQLASEDSSESGASNNAFQLALAQVVRHVVESRGEGDEGEALSSQTLAAFDPLQMNSILQNAYLMAMENSDLLLANFDHDNPIDPELTAFIDQVSSDPLTKKQLAAAKRAASRAAPARQPAGARARRAPAGELRTGAGARTPGLSIAETLALQRLAMSGNRRDYSTIQLLEDALRLDRSQGAAAARQLISLLQGETPAAADDTDSALLRALRQMTEALRPASDTQDLDPALAPQLQLARLWLEQADSVPAQLVSSAVDAIGLAAQSEHGVSAGMLLLLAAAVLAALAKGLAGAFRRNQVDTPEMKEKTRIENRERKKKWREENEERNKDNDLRCRVMKKGVQLFGTTDLEERRQWVQMEFEKRRNKRFLRKQMQLERKEAPAPRARPEQPPPEIPLPAADALALAAPAVSDADPQLVKSIVGIFHVFNGSQLRMDLALFITATTAAAAAAYAGQHSEQQLPSTILGILALLLKLRLPPMADAVAGVPAGQVLAFQIETGGVGPGVAKEPHPPTKGPDQLLSLLVKANAPVLSFYARNGRVMGVESWAAIALDLNRRVLTAKAATAPAPALARLTADVSLEGLSLGKRELEGEPAPAKRRSVSPPAQPQADTAAPVRPGAAEAFVPAAGSEAAPVSAAAATAAAAPPAAAPAAASAAVSPAPVTVNKLRKPGAFARPGTLSRPGAFARPVANKPLPRPVGLQPPGFGAVRRESPA